MKRRLVAWLWSHQPDVALTSQGLSNHVIRQDRRFLELFGRVRGDRRALISVREMYNLFRFAQRSREIEGDLAEVGVYRGGSARVLCEIKEDKDLHLFDTFQGMPPADARIDLHREGDFADTSLEDVQRYLDAFPGVHFHAGRFPESIPAAVKERRFSLVHLDVDLYGSTRDALEFFYPRLSRGGVLISHDYQSISCPGVRRAVDEFFSDKPESVVELWDTQCAILKS